LDSLWGSILDFFTYNLSGRLKVKISELFTTYNPKTTLYVSNLDWMTTATDEDAVTKIVFARGISNIPPFNVTVNDNVFNLPTEIVLPKTVRTVEKDAFTATALASASISYAGAGELKVEDGAFGTGVEPTIKSVELDREDEQELDHGNKVTYEVNEEEETTDVNMGELNNFLNELAVEVKSYKIELTFDADGNVDAKVSIYTTEGYYGYIKPVNSAEQE